MRCLKLILCAALFFTALPAAHGRGKAAGKKRPVTHLEKKKARSGDLPNHALPDPLADTTQPASTSSAPASRGPTRIDFDDRLIQGQSNKSGAVYLYDRKELKTRSMIKQRESFREEIVGGVYGGE